jgi:hypothetical protein
VIDDNYRNPWCYLVKGFVNGHGKNSLPIYAVFLGMSDGRSERLLRTRFLMEPVERDTPWSDLVTLLNAPTEPAEDGNRENSDPMQGYAERLRLFIHSERILMTEKKELDTKAIERDVTHFCAYDLDINAITFVDVTRVSESEASSMLTEFREKAPGDANGEDGQQADDAEPAADEENPNEVFIECGVVIDPVAGLPASKLSEGQEIHCRLPADSPFYKICETNLPNFNGIVTANVTGVKTNEFGNSVIAVSLAEGITGVMKVKGNIWIKTGLRASATHGIPSGELQRYMMLGAIGVALLLVAIGILFHLMD